MAREDPVSNDGIPKDGKIIGSDRARVVFTDEGETVFRYPAPPPPGPHPMKSGPETRGNRRDGISKPIPWTNNNRAPGQWGRS